jgi:hypothetical protein
MNGVKETNIVQYLANSLLLSVPHALGYIRFVKHIS